MNALSAIDEMMSANDINVNMAAITPAIMLAYLMARVFKFMGYTLLKLAKSREETYSSFRFVLTDIERLLVMRDDPPNSSTSEATDGSLFIPNHPPVLSGDDLGMLMLLLHECRGILWQDRRRFSPQEIRSVSEDLAELAGERGKVKSDGMLFSNHSWSKQPSVRLQAPCRYVNRSKSLSECLVRIRS